MPRSQRLGKCFIFYHPTQQFLSHSNLIIFQLWKIKTWGWRFYQILLSRNECLKNRFLRFNQTNKELNKKSFKRERCLHCCVVPFELIYIFITPIVNCCKNNFFNNDTLCWRCKILLSSSSESELSESELSSETSSFCIGFIVIVKAESSQSSCCSEGF